MLLGRRGLLVHAFDPAHARAIGLPVRLLHYGLLALVALTVVAALQAVGIILAIAVLISPGAIAFLWVRRFGPMLAVAVAVAVGAAIARRLRQLLDRLRPGADHRAGADLAFVASLVLTRLGRPLSG